LRDAAATNTNEPELQGRACEDRSRSQLMISRLHVAHYAIRQ
jgi:hypothetical protein